MRVCMLVTNPVTRDPRVRKEARTLRDAGHEVHVVGFIHTEADLPEELLDAIPVERVDTWTWLGGEVRHWHREMNARRKKSRLWRATDTVLHKWRHPLFFLQRRYSFLRTLIQVLRAMWTVLWRWLGPARRRVPNVLGQHTVIEDYLHLIKDAITAYTLPEPDTGATGVRGETGHSLDIRRRTSFSLKRLLEYNWPLLQSALRWRADVYHAHDFNTLPAAVVAARWHGAKLVYDSHELWAELHVLLPKHKLAIRIIEQFLIRQCDAVITVNASIAEELVRRYGIPRPIVVHNFPDEEVLLCQTEQSRLSL